jgi:hypothetical protein
MPLKPPKMEKDPRGNDSDRGLGVKRAAPKEQHLLAEKAYDATDV